MKFTLEIGDKSPNEKKNYNKQRKKYIRSARRRAILLTILTPIKVAFWYLYFKMKSNVFTAEYIKSIKSPWKLYTLMHTFFSVDYTNNSIEIMTLDRAMKKRVITEKSLVYIMAQLMKQYHEETYVFWCGYRSGFIRPMVVIVYGNVNISMSYQLKIHTGGQFEIMRRYFKDGTTWKVVDVYGETVILDYVKDRSEEGVPDILCLDMKHWMKNEPTVTHLARQWNLIYNNVDILKPYY